MRSVWIVQHDESPNNTVLGVFSSSQEADAFAAEVKGQFKNGVICSEFAIGYRFVHGSQRYSKS